MLMETEAGIWARADARVFRLLMDGDRSPRRLLAADRTIAGAIRRVAALRQRRAAQDAREHEAAERRLARELAPAWGRAVRVRVPLAKKGAGANNDTRRRTVMMASTSRRAIRAYTAPIRDARGRVAVYFCIRYTGLKSKGWRPGLAADHALYILRAEAQDHDGIADVAMPISNMGHSADEIAAGWRALEAMEEGYRANAKVQYRIVWNLPHDLEPDRRRALVEAYCERTFGRLGLPYVAAVHTADPKGDPRNVHAHILFSTRPCDHVGDHQWVIAQEKVNGLTDPAGLTLLRALAAGHMNLACRNAGREARYTHESYAKRGIDAVRQTHLGPARMAAHERGETVAAVTRNAQIVVRNETAVARDAAARAMTLAGRLTAALRQQMTIGAEQRRVSGLASVARSITAHARTLISRPRSPAPPLASETLGRHAQQARRVATMIATRPDVSAVTIRGLATNRLATRCRAASAVPRDVHRAALTDNRQRLGAIRARIADGRAIAAAAARQRLETLLFDATVPPYAIRGRKLVLDVSRFAEEDAAFIRTADHTVLGDALRERHRRDRARDEAEAAARRLAEEQRDAAEARQRRIDHACRLLRDVPGRPYRRNGNRLVPDLGVFEDADRAAIAAIGFREPAMIEALFARAKRDRALDEEAATAGRARRRDALERLFRALDEERHHLVYRDDGWHIPLPLLARFGVDGEAESDAGVQRRLARVAERQASEVSRIADHVGVAPHHLRQDDSHWTLDAAAPADLRRAVDAWRGDPVMQTALARAAAAVPVTAPLSPAPALDADTGWRAARAMRAAAMAASDADQRLDAAGLNTPGRPINRPGIDRRVGQRPPPGTPGLDRGG